MSETTHEHHPAPVPAAPAKEGLGIGFWIGQAVVIVCTVLGIYLAAVIGFQKAVDLTLLNSDRDTYYLAASFGAETQQNVDTVTAFLDEHEDAPFYPEGETLRLNLYVAEAMKFAGSTFELPPGVLNGVSSYYAEAGEIIDGLAARELNKQSGFKRLRELTEALRSDELARLDAVADGLRLKLVDNGIEP